MYYAWYAAPSSTGTTSTPTSHIHESTPTNLIQFTTHDTHLIYTHQTNLHSRISSTPANLIYESNLSGHQHLQVLRLHQHGIYTTPTLTSTSTISTCAASTRLPPPPPYVHVDVGVVVVYPHSRCRCSNCKYWCSVYYGVATISRMLKNICLFAEYRSLL